MKVNSLKRNQPDFPDCLTQIYDPPKIIYWVGAKPDDWLKLPRLAVVGSRKPTTYGRQAAYKLSAGAAQAGLVIVSGLAFGIDSTAHQAALDSGGTTVAVLPGPIDKLYPASHRQLAEQIVRNGGTLISEYPPGSEIRKHNFIARNRIIAALCDGLLVPQAASRSGSLHTANFALEQGKTVMAVPGEINIEMNSGSNNLLKTGAIMITEVEDIFSALGVKPRSKKPKKLFKATAAQQKIFELIGNGVSDQESLAAGSGLSGAELTSALGLLEIDGYICASGGHWTLN